MFVPEARPKPLVAVGGRGVGEGSSVGVGLGSGVGVAVGDSVAAGDSTAVGVGVWDGVGSGVAAGLQETEVTRASAAPSSTNRGGERFVIWSPFITPPVRAPLRGWATPTTATTGVVTTIWAGRLRSWLQGRQRLKSLLQSGRNDWNRDYGTACARAATNAVPVHEPPALRPTRIPRSPQARRRGCGCLQARPAGGTLCPTPRTRGPPDSRSR